GVRRRHGRERAVCGAAAPRRVGGGRERLAAAFAPREPQLGAQLVREPATHVEERGGGAGFRLPVEEGAGLVVARPARRERGAQIEKADAGRDELEHVDAGRGQLERVAGAVRGRDDPPFPLQQPQRLLDEPVVQAEQRRVRAARGGAGADGARAVEREAVPVGDVPALHLLQSVGEDRLEAPGALQGVGKRGEIGAAHGLRDLPADLQEREPPVRAGEGEQVRVVEVDAGQAADLARLRFRRRRGEPLPVFEKPQHVAQEGRPAAPPGRPLAGAQRAGLHPPGARVVRRVPAAEGDDRRGIQGLVAVAAGDCLLECVEIGAFHGPGQARGRPAVRAAAGELGREGAFGAGRRRRRRAGVAGLGAEARSDQAAGAAVAGAGGLRRSGAGGGGLGGGLGGEGSAGESGQTVVAQVQRERAPYVEPRHRDPPLALEHLQRAAEDAVAQPRRVPGPRWAAEAAAADGADQGEAAAGGVGEVAARGRDGGRGVEVLDADGAGQQLVDAVEAPHRQRAQGFRVRGRAGEAFEPADAVGAAQEVGQVAVVEVDGLGAVQVHPRGRQPAGRLEEGQGGAEEGGAVAVLVGAGVAALGADAGPLQGQEARLVQDVAAAEQRERLGVEEAGAEAGLELVAEQVGAAELDGARDGLGGPPHVSAGGAVGVGVGVGVGEAGPELRRNQAEQRRVVEVHGPRAVLVEEGRHGGKVFLFRGGGGGGGGRGRRHEGEDGGGGGGGSSEEQAGGAGLHGPTVAEGRRARVANWRRGGERGRGRERERNQKSVWLKPSRKGRKRGRKRNFFFFLF
ncbi:MAG: hypothetical protein BJ554DRAFT_3213, partial [Olpidium bornovanus]